MANAGLSVKERLALLQHNNNNNSSSNNNNAGDNPVKPPSLSPKPKLSPTEIKPGGIAGLKPVTASKPTTDNHKPVPSNKPVTSDTKPFTSNKPTIAGKPGAIGKPFIVPKPGADDAGKTNGSDSSPFPKLRPVGAPPGKLSPSVPLKSVSPSREIGAVKNSESSKHEGSQGTDGSDSSVEIREKSSTFTPLKPVSVQERLAALRKKSLCEDTMQPKHNDSALSKSPVTAAKSPVTFSPSSKPPFANGPKFDSAGPNFNPIKPSDIAKSLNQAAGRVLRNKAAEKTSEDEAKRVSNLFQRHSDGKKFRKVDVSTVISSEPAPPKPKPIDNVDLTTFVKAYAAAKQDKLKSDAEKGGISAGEENGEMEEEYVEAESMTVAVRSRKGSVKRASSVRVSAIPEYTEEEEEEELYTDGRSGQEPPPLEAPEEMYDDCQSSVTEFPPPPPPLKPNQEFEDPEELYEPLGDEIYPEPEPEEPERPPPPLHTLGALPALPDDKTAKDKEKEDREKEEAARKKEKAKEELNKKEEKERRKKEEDLKKLRRKFGLSDTDERVGDGVVKSNASGGMFSKDLSVVKGETIAILRMDGNPAGKWLGQNEHGKIGFVNSNNIEISTPTIRHLMAGVKAETGSANEAEEPEELYEALPEDEMDEIYEEL